MLLGKTAKVGYFRPIIDNVKKGKKDNHIKTIISHFDLNISPKDAFAYTRSEFIHLRNDGKEGEIFDTIIEKYKAMKLEAGLKPKTEGNEGKETTWLI